MKSANKYHLKNNKCKKKEVSRIFQYKQKVSKIPTRNSAKTPKTRSKIKLVKNNQQKEDSRRKMQEYNSNIVITNIRIKDDRSPFCV